MALPRPQAAALVADDQSRRAAPVWPRSRSPASVEPRDSARAARPPPAASAGRRGQRQAEDRAHAPRTTLGWYGSTPRLPKTTPEAPKASADRSSVPAFPGSLRSASDERERRARGVARAACSAAARRRRSRWGSRDRRFSPRPVVDDVDRKAVASSFPTIGFHPARGPSHKSRGSGLASQRFFEQCRTFEGESAGARAAPLPHANRAPGRCDRRARPVTVATSRARDHCEARENRRRS